MNLDDLKKSINEISVYDFSSYSAIELCYVLGDKIKVCAEALNYLLTLGVKDEVVKQLEIWKNDGTLDTIINENLYSDLCEKVEEFKKLSMNTRPFPEIHFIANKDYIGDCIIIKNRYGEYIMIDTCGNPDYDYVKARIDELGITKIKTLFITHSHDDHIGNATAFIHEYKIEKVYLRQIDLDFKKYGGDISNQQFVHDCLIHTCRDLNIPMEEYKEGQIINISDEETIRPLAVNYWSYDEYNDASIPLLYNFKGVNILLLSDATPKVQNYILNHYSLPRVDILKLAHHGFNDEAVQEMIKTTYPCNSVFNGYFQNCEKTRGLCQYYESNMYYVGHDKQNKGRLSFIIGTDNVSTSSKQRLLLNYWGMTDDGKEFFLNGAGQPIGQEVINYKGRFYYMDEGFSLFKNGWHKFYYDNEYLWFYAHEDGTLAQCEWIKNDVKWCYLKPDCHMAISERIYIDGEYRTFDVNGNCTNPPTNLEV